DDDRVANRRQAKAAHVAQDAVVLGRRDLSRVPASAALLALPPLAVGDLAELTALALDGDRRSPHIAILARENCQNGGRLSPDSTLHAGVPGVTFAADFLCG